MGLLVICLAAMALLFILLKAVRRRLPRAEQPEGGTKHTRWCTNAIEK